MTCHICAKTNCIGECEPKIQLDDIDVVDIPAPVQQEPVDWEAVAADQAMTIGLLKAVLPAERKPLTDEEIQECWYKTQGDAELFARAIEAAHGIKEPS